MFPIIPSTPTSYSIERLKHPTTDKNDKFVKDLVLLIISTLLYRLAKLTMSPGEIDTTKKQAKHKRNIQSNTK